MSDEALTYVELDIDYCSLTYGTAPCTASVGVTGAAKCFNSLVTCQDSAHFTNSPVTLRFSVDTGHNPVEIEALPFIASHDDVAITPGRISLGEDLGQRESVSVTFGDRPHPDTGPGFDKYLADRTYDPYSQGTFWGKFKARQPYLKGRALRLYRGFVGDALADMECRHYIVDSYTGPGVDGRYTIIAKDILKLLDGDQAQAPALSKGSLSGSLTSSGTSATLSPSGIGDTDYPASGKIAIGGKEIMSFTRSGDTLTLSNRASNGTTAIAHSAGDRVQLVLEYSAQRPDQIVADLMQNYGGVDPAYLPTATWQTETETFNRRLYTGIIAEPTPVRTLIKEMIQQAGLAIWWDPTEQLVFLQVLRAVTSDAAVYDETNIMLQGGLGIAEQPDKRVSQVWVYYGQRNPLDGQDDPSNYRSCEIILDTEAEANYGAAAIQKIYSRWIAFGGLTTAERIGNLQLGRYVNPPRKFAFNLLRAAGLAGLVLGAGYYIGNPELQAADGSRVNVPVQITRDRSDAGLHAYEAEENRYVSYDSDDNLTVVIDSNVRSLNLRTLYDSLYSTPLAGDTVTFVVNENVVVGATSTSVPAIDTGTWPSVATTGNRTSGSPTLSSIADTSTFAVGMIVKGTGIPAGAKILSKTANSITLDANATSGSGTSTALTVYTVLLVLDVRGRVQGAGGIGGNGARGPAGTPNPGSAGGTALKATSALSVIIRTGGSIKGGGGGGGGAGTRIYSNHNGGGGGGGAGDGVGAGGYPGGPYAAQGAPGTLDTGGVGGYSWTTNGGLFEQPHALGPPNGGTGGAPGMPGAHGDNSDSAGGVGGAAGNAIDGESYVKLTNSGTVAGPTIN